MRKLAGLTEKELLTAFRNGCAQAFDVLLMRHRTSILRVILYYVKEPSLAEDLAQDAFLKIYTSLKAGRYNDEGKFLSWALRIAYNLCMDHMRREKRRAASLQLSRRDPERLPAEVCAEGKMIERQQAGRLDSLVRKLSEEQQQVVTARYYEELTFREIAVRMNTSVNTSVGRLRYALEHLRRQVGNDPSFAWHS